MCQSGRLLRSNKPLGVYKMDIGTVYAAQGIVCSIVDSQHVCDVSCGSKFVVPKPDVVGSSVHKSDFN